MEVTVRLKIRVKIQLILLLFVTQILNGVEFKKQITINPKGWNIPDISKIEKVAEREIQISEEIPPIINAACQKRKDLKDGFLRTINKRISVENKINNIETLEYYEVEYFNSLNIYIFKKSKKILCYQYARVVSGKTAKDFINQIIFSLQKDLFFDEGIGGEFTSTFIFDADDDGIFESSIFDPLNGNSIEVVKKIFDYKRKLNKNVAGNHISKKLDSFRKKWVQYLNYSSKQNAKNVLETLCELGYKGSNILKKSESEYWEWVWDTLPTLEKDVFASEPYAVKIAFKLLPISIDTFSGRVIEILENFIRINPEMFLEELKDNRSEVKFSIFGSKGIEDLGYANLVSLEIKKRINSLKSVKDPELNDIKKEIIDILETELKHIKKK